eukprot:3510944-Pyramimonas_sp.AAC.1
MVSEEVGDSHLIRKQSHNHSRCLSGDSPFAQLAYSGKFKGSAPAAPCAALLHSLLCVFHAAS